MLTLHSRLGVVDLAGTVVLTLAHAALTVAYLVPGLARGVYTPTPGRVSVITYIDQAGPVFSIGFGITTVLLALGLARPRLLPMMHSLSGGFMTIFTTGLWFGFAASDPRPSVLTAIMATIAMMWHVTLVVTYSAAASLPVRAGGHRPRGETTR